MTRALLASLLLVLSGCAGSASTATSSATTLSSASVSRWSALVAAEPPQRRVHWPDGHVTVGASDLIDLFAFAPDTQVEGEPTNRTSGEWTTRVRTMSGHFTSPRSTAAGDVAPTGKPFRIWLATITHRSASESGSPVDDEYVFWSERTLRNQIDR